MLLKIPAKLAPEEIRYLLMESDHRTSNSLQLLSAVLRMQARASENPAARDAFLEAGRRIQCISHMHRKLCSTARGERIALDDYLLDIRDDFAAAFLSERSVELIVNADPILVEPAVACTIGLVLNELVTNALKHGAMAGRTAIIDVNCGSLDENTIELRVSNDAPAMHTAAHDAAGGGTKIMKALIAQYAGKLIAEREGRRIVHTMTLSLA